MTTLGLVCGVLLVLSVCNYGNVAGRSVRRVWPEIRCSDCPEERELTGRELKCHIFHEAEWKNWDTCMKDRKEWFEGPGPHCPVGLEDWQWCARAHKDWHGEDGLRYRAAKIYFTCTGRGR